MIFRLSIAILFSFQCMGLMAQDFDLIPYLCDSKWGFADKMGQVKIPIKYDSVGFFYKEELRLK